MLPPRALIPTVVFATALGVSIFLTPVVERMATRFGLLDRPMEARRLHQRPVPRLGGLAVFAASLLALGLARFLSGAWLEPPAGGSTLLGVLCGGAVVFAAGVVDDLWGLSPTRKLIAEGVAGLIAIWFGICIHAVSIGSGVELQLGRLAWPVTLFWMVGVTNAFNLIDGLDGLASGIAIVALAAIAATAFALQNVVALVVAVALLGALVGFLGYNFNPARIFLGDSGSLFVGFLLATLSITGALSGPDVLIAVPVFSLAVPILDALFAVARRWLRGLPISAADARHVHHRLLALGFGQRGVALILYAAAALLAAYGFGLAFAPAGLELRILAVGGTASLLLLAFVIRRLGYHEFSEAVRTIVLSAPRARRVIRDQILARDVSVQIRRADDLETVQSLLLSVAPSFGFVAMELTRGLGDPKLPVHEGRNVRAWHLDYPVFLAGEPKFRLRIWCYLEDGNRPYGAERVAGALAPTLRERLQEWRANPVLEAALPRLPAGAEVLPSAVGGHFALEQQQAPR